MREVSVGWPAEFALALPDPCVAAAGGATQAGKRGGIPVSRALCNGSDGTRTRDLRDRPVMALPGCAGVGGGFRHEQACPDLIATDASRTWFDGMSAAQSLLEAAVPVVRLPLDSVDPRVHGELVQVGRVFPCG